MENYFTVRLPKFFVKYINAQRNILPPARILFNVESLKSWRSNACISYLNFFLLNVFTACYQTQSTKTIFYQSRLHNTNLLNLWTWFTCLNNFFCRHGTVSNQSSSKWTNAMANAHLYHSHHRMTCFSSSSLFSIPLVPWTRLRTTT